MTGDEFREIREALGLGVVAFGRALGYGGADNTVSVTIRRYERLGARSIPPRAAAAAAELNKGRMPPE